MMKKEYLKPTVELVHINNMVHLLAGSVNDINVTIINDDDNIIFDPDLLINPWENSF